MRIAILGSTSEIAKDLILSFALNTNHEILLFCRERASLTNWLKNLCLSNKLYVYKYDDFYNIKNIDAIINFIGVGDPRKAVEMGVSIIEVTELFDRMALKYLKKNTSCKYLYISSGAVYGGEFITPPTRSMSEKKIITKVDIKNYYALSKIQAEQRHRSLFCENIIDIRIFSYFSHTQNFNSSFFMSEVIRALQKNEVLITGPENIYRDYLGARDFFRLISCALMFSPKNIAVDAYTLSPVGKFELLERLNKNYGLKYSIESSGNSQYLMPQKINYYSKNYKAKEMGYQPLLNSIESIMNEVSIIMDYGK